MDPESLVGASQEMLKEIHRQAELQLSAQLQAGIGADARALYFISLMAAATVVVAGGAVASFTSLPPNVHLAWTCVAMVAGFVISMAFAVASARPTGFDYAGSWPVGWVVDVKKGVSLHVALARQLADMNERLSDNSHILKNNARWMRLALCIAVVVIVVGCFIGVLIIAVK